MGVETAALQDVAETISLIGDIATSVGTIVGIGAKTYGTIQAAESEARVDRMNADIARQEAELTSIEIVKAQEKGALDIQKQRRFKREILSAQAAAYSKAGVALSGSPLLVMENTLAEVNLDILITRYDLEVEKQRLLSQRQRFISQAQFDEESAALAERTGRLKAGTSLLEGIPKILTSVGNIFETTGVFKKKTPARETSRTSRSMAATGTARA